MQLLMCLTCVYNSIDGKEGIHQIRVCHNIVTCYLFDNHWNCKGDLKYFELLNLRKINYYEYRVLRFLRKAKWKKLLWFVVSNFSRMISALKVCCKYRYVFKLNLFFLPSPFFLFPLYLFLSLLSFFTE